MSTQMQDDVTVAYETYGEPSDAPLVLVHGLGADHSMWTPQIERYPNEGRYLITPDVRGHGDSDPVSTFRIKDCAADLVMLLDELSIQTAMVVGVSMGGLISQQLAIEYPDRVRKLVLADTFSNVHGIIPRFSSKLAFVSLSILPTRLQIALIETHYDAPEDAQLRRYFRTQLRETSSTQLKQARRASNRFDCRAGLHKINVPTLVLAGGENPSWFMNLAQETADGIDKSAFVTLDGGSDPSNLTATDRFDEAVLSFLQPNGSL